MHLNADFTQRVVIRPADYSWTSSPSGGVDRMMLDRIGDEVARATTIVRFAPGSRFQAHTHGGGEEFLVLEGVFSDETGDFPKGSYVRNPVGTSHTPHTDPGCTILVKLHQFAAEDTVQVHVRTPDATFKPSRVPGMSVLSLHQAGDERVSLIRIAPGTRIDSHPHPGGEEIFVLEGTLADEHGTYPAGSWIRNPHGSEHSHWSDDGCLLWMKTGHLEHVIGLEAA